MSIEEAREQLIEAVMALNGTRVVSEYEATWHILPIEAIHIVDVILAHRHELMNALGYEGPYA